MAENEQQMVARLLAPLSEGLEGAFGLRDDAAALRPPPGCEFVITMDTLIEGVHFLFDGTSQSSEMAAHKALAVNVSDLAAKGAQPYAYLLSLALPNTSLRSVGVTDPNTSLRSVGVTEPNTSLRSVEHGNAERLKFPWLDAFCAALGRAQAAWGLRLAGGDTVSSPGAFAITITAIGIVDAGRMVRRSTASAGDLLYVSGTIGDAYAGLRLSRGDVVRSDWQRIVGAVGVDALVARSRTPTPRVCLIPAVRKYAAAALDVSDGLALDASRLASASGLGCQLDADAVPLSAPARMLVEAGEVTIAEALTGGDDYEILAAVTPDEAMDYEREAAAAGVVVARIGRLVTGEGICVRDSAGTLLALERLGWDHLAHE